MFTGGDANIVLPDARPMVKLIGNMHGNEPTGMLRDPGMQLGFWTKRIFQERYHISVSHFFEPPTLWFQKETRQEKNDTAGKWS